MPSRSLGHRAPLLWLVLPLMGGLAVGKILNGWWTPWLLVAALLSVAICVARPASATTAICSAMFLAGIASYALHRPRLADWDELPPREARLTLRVDRTFGQRDPHKLGGLATVIRGDEPLQELAGQRIYFSFTLRRGDLLPIRSAIIFAQGVIAALPNNPPGNTFDSYLANAGINFRLSRARMLTEEKPPNGYYRFCALQAQRFSSMLGNGVISKRPELVGVLRAMLLGQQHELSEEQVANYRATGTMHVFSISGLHIAVIATGLHALLSLFRLPRLARFPLGLIALWLYVDITGGAPSAIRAFVMVAVVEFALALRLPRNPLSALTASTLIVLLYDPLQMFGASFQMSYGIVAALLLLGLPLGDCWQQKLALFRYLPKPAWGWQRTAIDAVWRGIVSAAAIGMAASLVSALTGILFFNLLTPGAFLTNLWLIPASSLVIYMGMLSLMAGIAGVAICTALANHAAIVVLWLIEAGIHFSMKLPAMWFAASFRSTWIGPVSLMSLFALLIIGYRREWRGWHRWYWPPFAVVVLVLIFGVQFP